MATNGACACPTCAQSSRNYWIDAVDAYMQRCMERKTSARASELANELDLTPSAIARQFKKAVGVKLIEYMKKRQLQCAKRLLSETDRSASSVAETTGWGTSRTFFRAFRKATGMTPLQYRHQTRNVGCGNDENHTN